MDRVSASLRHRGVILLGAMLALVLVPVAARADCAEELGGLMKKRMAEVSALNQNTRSHKGKLDPIQACPQLRSLAATEANVIAYMTKNKDWCSLPDDLVSKMQESHTRTVAVAAKACEFAVKLKKMQEQQAAAPQQQQQALKLPAGPL